MTATADDTSSATPDVTGGGPLRPGARTTTKTISRRRSRAPLPIAALVAVVWAGSASFACVWGLVAVACLGTGLDAGGVTRIALAGWLLAHGVPVSTATDQITLVPLALSGLAAWRVGQAGVHAGRAIDARRSRLIRPTVLAAVLVALAYALLGGLTAAAVRGPEVTVSPARAALTFSLFALVSALATTLPGSRAARRWWRGLPAVLTDAARTGVIASLLLVAAGAATAGLALAVRGGEATEMLDSYQAGVFGQGGMTMVFLAYLPNLAVWSTAYLLGPGFAVGVGTSVTPSAVVLGPIPAVPVLAGLPASPAGGVMGLVFTVPVVAAMCAGWLLARRLRRGAPVGQVPRWSRLLGAAVGAGPVAGVLLGTAATVAGGALGSGLLARLGPVGWRVGGYATVVVTVGVLVGAVAARLMMVSRR